MFIRTFGGSKMSGTRLWLVVVVLQSLLLTAHGAKPHRRSMPTQQTLSKGGWRPVVGSSGLVFNFGTAPLHAPHYKIQAPHDSFPSSARPISARDAAKLTSIAQSYRPTTLRTVSAAPPSPAASQPINSYLNPFALPNNGLTHYKYVQNFPVDSVLIRNPHNPFAARPVFSKPYPTKQQQYNLKQQQYFQQLGNIQPLQFPIQTAKPLDIFGKPVNGYAKPTDTKASQSQSGMEIYKTEVIKLPDSAAAGQQVVSQQVKTAQQQQQTQSTPKIPVSPFPHYHYQDPLLPPNILGTFGSFGVQSVKPRDPIFSTKTAFFPQTTKQTLFNSFSYAPNFKTTPTFVSTTPKLQTTANQIHLGSNWNDFKGVVTQAPKLVTPAKIDPNTNKGTFKPSPQDPFVTKLTDYKVSTYNPTVQTTTFAYSNFHDNYYAQQQSPQVQQYYNTNQQNNQQNINQQNYQQNNNQQNYQQHNNQQNYQQHNNQQHYQQNNNQQNYQQHNNQQNYQQNNNQQSHYQQNNQQNDFSYEKKKHKIHAHDSLAAGVNQQISQQYANPPKNTDVEGTPNSVPFRATYEVTETYENDDITYSSPQNWPGTQESNGQIVTEEVITKPDSDAYIRPTTILPEIPEELAIVTEGDKGYDNSLGYDNQFESQSRRPLGDDFEPIVKHKLKDYYYRVSTPTYDDHSGRRKKPTESSRYSTQEAPSNFDSNKENNEADPLPTLPPNKHFKRPSSPAPETVDKDRIRKRNKVRRRRPLGNGNGNRESSTRKYSTTTEATTSANDELHTIRPRARPTASKPSLTTPTTSAVDLTTSAIPTISPTAPTIIKKKLIHRRPLATTTTEKPDTTSEYTHESNKESPIMKISATSNRVHYSKPTPSAFEYNSETPDYTHKQDEKDTPTSDIAVNLSDIVKTTSKTETTKSFSFHRDAKPVEAKLEPIIREILPTEAPKDSDENDVTTTPRIETTSNTGKILRPRLKNKFDRPRFSVKDYRNRLSSTTSTEKPADTQTPKIRFPNRRAPSTENKISENENGTERKKFMPKDPRHKLNGSETNEQNEKEIHSLRPHRQRQNVETTEGPVQKISARIRNGSRRPKPEESVETTIPTTNKRPLRKKIKDSDIGESVQDVSVTETASDQKNDITSERTRSESAIMKIADKKHQDHHLEHIFEHSKRVSDLTLAASKDYNTPGMFKTVSTSSRRIPNYFTIATDDPILPIEAFFPQINQKKES